MDQGFGMHVDNAYIHSKRCDLSLTLFMSKTDSYDGSSLYIQTLQDSKQVTLRQAMPSFLPKYQPACY